MYCVNRLKKENHMSTTLGAEKVFDKTQYPFMIFKKNTKNLSVKKIEGTSSTWGRISRKKPTADVMIDGEKLEVFPLTSGTRQGSLLSPLLFKH